MPRPGPRLYECVRRAWHSERHQPMRGLIIQQIFRLVHDNHSSATKKNKEWQDNLPIVVLKAEEIIYSKANSEAEYSNIETLWDRVNDAINTIIRKDETAETGELLSPCVEAALNLGCIPIRASRSQRHNNPRSYLRPYQEFNSMSPRFLNDNVNEQSPDLVHTRTSICPMLKIPQNVDSSRLLWECRNRISPNPNRHIGMEVDNSTTLNRGSVYPLYYGTSLNHQSGFQEAERSDSVIIGMPVFSSAAEYASQGGGLQNLFPYGEDKNVGKKTFEAPSKDNKGKRTEVGFDLSLRLGIFSDSNPSREKGYNYVNDSLYEGQLIEKEFSFFPMESPHNPFWLHKSKQYKESENGNAELVSRKRKLPFSGNIENEQFFWSRDSSNHFVGQMRRHAIIFGAHWVNHAPYAVACKHTGGFNYL